MSTTSEDSKITATESKVAEPQFDPEMPAGVPEGTIDKENEDVPEPVRDRIEHREVIVHETDGKGNVVGFHKEAAPAADGEDA